MLQQQTEQRPVVGFAGLGVMGGPMAEGLLRAGYSVRVWTRDRTKTERFADRGVIVAGDPHELAEASDIVLSCLLNSDVIRSVYLGDRGLLSGARPGAVFVEHGTFAPQLAVDLFGHAAERDVEFLDAPVTGGQAAAASGQLVIMAGGRKEAVDRVADVLSSFARKVVWAGQPGNGLRLKLINQMLVTVHAVAAGEAAKLIRSAGLDRDAAISVLTSGWGASTMLERSLPLALDGVADQDSSAPLGGLLEAQQLIAAMSDVPLPVFESAAARFGLAVDLGWQRRDLAAMADLPPGGKDQM
ncbi:NAD(P)-dependent oxidoreductase [Streptomyces chartreusis]|uniref:NAD(P)-dependent oxidoreductase n=1 Tax=Streptomyces chartreusis TaxID=1969 RepID=A0A7H8T1P1_STRCX|nr:NAD(P)-dependent oxidoreductase [Streptomyces chartreusis]QKZ17294.1 NAD(P)-dependent oxidoreductase [Streptomyces chartreusis]